MISLLIAAWMANVPLEATPGTMFPLAFDATGEVRGVASEFFYSPSQPRETTTGEFCFTRGVYQMDAHLSMAPADTSEAGWLYWSSSREWLHSRYLMSWHSQAGRFSDLASSTVVFESEDGECFRLMYGSTGPAIINSDPRATNFSIRKLQ